MPSKLFFVSLISFASLLLCAANLHSSDDQLAYNFCLQKHSNSDYCKVLIWGRWVTNNNSRKVSYTLWEYFCAQNVIVHTYYNKNLENLLTLILILDSDVQSRDLQRQPFRRRFAYYAAHVA